MPNYVAPATENGCPMQVFTDVFTTWQLLRINKRRIVSLPRWHQLLEMIVLYLFRGIGPGYYLQARWWRPEIPFKNKWLHHNKKEYLKFISGCNPRVYQKATQHKVLEKSVLTLLNIPTPHFLGFLHKTAGIQKNGQSLKNADDLVDLCHSLVGEKICLKPVEGYGGAGFAAFKIQLQNQQPVFTHPVDNQTLSIHDWFHGISPLKNGYIIESYLEQHPSLSQLNQYSLNTLRIILCQKNGEVKVFGAYLRLGVNKSLVDNISSGGIYCPVDLATGKIFYAIHPSNPVNTIVTHPDSGAPIDDFQIPFWSECQELAGRALLAFPHMQFAGVDVAICENGPQMIELNVQPDQIGCAWIDLPLKKVDLWLRGNDKTS